MRSGYATVIEIVYDGPGFGVTRVVVIRATDKTLLSTVHEIVRHTLERPQMDISWGTWDDMKQDRAHVNSPYWPAYEHKPGWAFWVRLEV